MGASQEKRRRQENSFAGLSSAKRNDEAALKTKKTRRNTIIIIIVVALFLLASLFVNSKLLRRNGTALNIGDSKVSIAEFNYFYYNTYYEYNQNVRTYYPDYADSMLPSTNQPLTNQIYDEATGQTWADYIASMAIDKLSGYYAMYNEAKATGYKISDECQQKIDNEVASIEPSMEGTSFKNVNKYLSTYYGKGMNLNTFRKCVEVMYTASEYNTYYGESLTYTDEQIADKIAENPAQFAQYDYRSFYVAADAVSESDFTSDEEYENAKSAALDEAKKTAEQYQKGIKSEEDFIEAAKKYNADTYSTDATTKYSQLGSSVNSVCRDWVMESSRKTGDTTVIQSGNGYYVVFYCNKTENDYNTVDIRIIRISPDTINEEDYADEKAYSDAVATEFKNAEARANDLYEQWKSEGGTEELFIKYANENSSLSLDGGLFENVYKNALSHEANDWCFNSSRKTGDTTVISSKDDNCCYIIWFIGEGEIYKEYLAESNLRNDDYQAWTQKISDNVEVNKTWLYKLTK